MTVSFDWIRKIPRSLLLSDVKPMGNISSFPWKDFSDKIQKSLELPKLEISQKVPEWIEKNRFLEGFVEAEVLKLAAPAIPGFLYFIVSRQDLNLFSSHLLFKENKPYLDENDQELLEGFYKFIALEAIFQAGKSGLKAEFLPKIERLESLIDDQESALAIDLLIDTGFHQFTGRLLISPEFHKAFVSKSNPSTEELIASSPIAEATDLTLHLEIGKTSLKENEWNSIETGDFLILDYVSLNPAKGEGRVLIKALGRPLYLGELQGNTLKILESSAYSEADNMQRTPHDHNEEGFDEEDEDFEFDEDALEEFDEEFDEDFDEDEFDETDSSHEDEDDDEDDYHDEDDEEEEDLNDLEETQVKKEEAKPSKADLTKSPSSEAPEKKEPAREKTEALPKQKLESENPIELLKTGEVPLTINVEIGRLHISLRKLMELKPGNLIELTAKPEDGVDLVLNGKRLARGELIQVGEVLGVRILDIGKK